MKTDSQICEIAKKALHLEAQGVLNLCQYIDQSFPKIVRLILTLSGRVILTGIGKSAIIAQKITATLNSTGTSAIFMHAADAVHGDLGMIKEDDVVICISKSGNTPEIKLLVPLLKRGGNKLIGMVGDTRSFLATQADFILNTTVAVEACPHNLAPTTSTTAQLAMGDALAMCLLASREFTSADFAKYHPGGSLGKRLYLKVGDLAVQNAKPQATLTTSVKTVLIEITKNRLGAVAIVENDAIIGIITDGDIRRMLETSRSIENLRASDIMNTAPKYIEKDELAVNAMELLRKYSISQLLVSSNGKYVGMVHFHDLLKEGII